MPFSAYPKSDAMDEWRDVDLGDTASNSESERYKNDSRREWWLEMTKPVPKFPDPDGPMPSKGLRPDKASYLQRFRKISKITLISLLAHFHLLLLDTFPGQL